jgi:hypothetical protein
MQKHAWMIVTKHGNPVVMDYRVPIYWKRKMAIEDAYQFGGLVVNIPMPHARPEQLD